MQVLILHSILTHFLSFQAILNGQNMLVAKWLGRFPIMDLNQNLPKKNPYFLTKKTLTLKP
jgi:hypothetical protein